MINCDDVYILKSGLFRNRMGMVEGSEVKFLIKNGGKLYDLYGNVVTLFLNDKKIKNLGNDFISCDYYGQDSVLCKLYDKEN
ncbi:MAG: hypothetical protein ACI4TX_01990, partial [Christensenellales bacterium]